jgi:hypothetical protein
MPGQSTTKELIVHVLRTWNELGLKQGGLMPPVWRSLAELVVSIRLMLLASFALFL